MENRYVPDYAVTPGEVLENCLETAGFTQASLSDRTGLSKKTINGIINAKSPITAETALKFERALGRPAHFWSNLERQYQEDKIRLADKIKLESSLKWLDRIPINSMVKLGWIEKFKDKVKQLEAALCFFAVVSPEQWETIWARDLHIAFRKRKSTKDNIGVISAWLRRGEICAQEIPCKQFDKKKFQNCLDEIRWLTLERPETFIGKLQKICAGAGVAVVFVPALPNLGI
jgi:addiction module HigA family antidote